MTEVKRPYIKDKTLFSAVSFAKKLIDLGEPMKKWIGTPAKYYKISEDVLRAEMIRQGYLTENQQQESSPELDEIFG